MSNLKTLKTRIKSVKSTQKMTKAMKMVAASKLRKAKLAVESSRPYAAKIDELITNIAGNIDFRGNLSDDFTLLTGREEEKTHLVVVLTSDRGLCGGLNTSAVKFAKLRIKELVAQGREVKIICVGKKGYDQLKIAHQDKIIDHISGIFRNNIDYKTAEEITNKIISLFKDKVFDVCEVVYSKFKSAIAQEASIKQIIPIKINREKVGEDISKYDSPIDYEPNKEEILHTLLPRNLTTQIFNQLLENSSSEQGARMAAMESATNNAGKMIKELTLVYNRTRQANITKELIDIVSGANAV
ncbi:MAG: F-type H+-transporting ATPase subunit gamma [Rickettsiales bacterium]|jgi:F-type H+-transporting ATPase subunit gamma